MSWGIVTDGGDSLQLDGSVTSILASFLSLHLLLIFILQLLNLPPPSCPYPIFSLYSLTLFYLSSFYRFWFGLSLSLSLSLSRLPRSAAHTGKFYRCPARRDSGRGCSLPAAVCRDSSSTEAYTQNPMAHGPQFVQPEMRRGRARRREVLDSTPNFFCFAAAVAVSECFTFATIYPSYSVSPHRGAAPPSTATSYSHQSDIQLGPGPTLILLLFLFTPVYPAHPISSFPSLFAPDDSFTR